MESFPALLALSEGNLPAQSPVTLSFDVSIDLRLNRRLSKQSSPGDLKRHCNADRQTKPKETETNEPKHSLGPFY